MKQSILLLAILFSFNTLSAHDNGAKKPVDKLERISGDRFFYVTYRYIDACGVGRVGCFVCSSRYAYPSKEALQICVADITCSNHQSIKITGIDSISKSDYKALYK